MTSRPPSSDPIRRAPGARIAVSLLLCGASILVYWQHHPALLQPKPSVAPPPVAPPPAAAPPVAAPPPPQAAPQPEAGAPPAVTAPVQGSGDGAVPPPPEPRQANNDAAPLPAPVPKKPAPKKNSDSNWKDGTFTGNPVDIEYGLVQVSAVIEGGVLTGIKWLQDPEDIDLSKQINTDAMPKLTAEAIQGQKAQVDLVTGATFTAMGFRLSLATALAQAGGPPP